MLVTLTLHSCDLSLVLPSPLLETSQHTHIYVRANARLLHSPRDLTGACALPMFDTLRLAHARLSVASATPVQDLSLLLSGSTPPPQRVLSEGVWDGRQAAVRGEQPDGRERARVCSAAGQHAGAWLGAVPVSDRLRALPRQFQLALCMRLGAPISACRAAEACAVCVWCCRQRCVPNCAPTYL